MSSSYQDNPPLYRVSKVPRSILPLSKSTIYRLIREGRIHTVHISRGCVCISQAEIDRFLASAANNEGGAA